MDRARLDLPPTLRVGFELEGRWGSGDSAGSVMSEGRFPHGQLFVVFVGIGGRRELGETNPTRAGSDGSRHRADARADAAAMAGVRVDHKLLKRENNTLSWANATQSSQEVQEAPMAKTSLVPGGKSGGGRSSATCPALLVCRDPFAQNISEMLLS